MDNKKLYAEIIERYQKNGSVQETSLELGVSRNTVQRVLLTEGLWESERSREVDELVKLGYTTQQIADKLFLSVKCVQNYMPYTKGMYQETETVDSVNSKRKRERNNRALQGRRKLLGFDREEAEKEYVEIPMEDFISERKEISLGNTDHFEVERPKTANVWYLPSVYKLRLELVDFNGDKIRFTENQRKILTKHAKYKDGFIRDVLVPSNMSLKALNYIILRLFGWDNSHIHEFALTENDFSNITKGRILKVYEALCGVCFRFPGSDILDQYCPDDFDGTKSIKTWFRSKYCGAEFPFSVGDTYVDNKACVKNFEKDFIKGLHLGRIKTVDEIEAAVDMGSSLNKLLERLSLIDILLPVYAEKPTFDAWLSKVKKETAELDKLIDSLGEKNQQYIDTIKSMDELRRRRISQAEMEMIASGRTSFHDTSSNTMEEMFEFNKKRIDYISERCHKIFTDLEPRISPFTDTILYRYDFGNGWCVKITCVDGYYINDFEDNPNDAGWIRIPVSDKDASEDRDFYGFADNQMVEPSLTEHLRRIVEKREPLCVYADGLPLIDDIGGVYGYVDMLRDIYGKDEFAAEQMREFARDMGWTGRMGKPEKML